MYDLLWIEEQAALTLKRLLPRINAVLENDSDADLFADRLHVNLPQILENLLVLYGERYDFFYHLEQIILSTAQMFTMRPSSLRQLDLERENDPTWHQNEQMIGGVLYVDRFAGDLNGVRERIPYLRELGLTYLHLMPLFDAPEESDGGYAVSDYRTVNPALGTSDDLRNLADELRENGISLVMDFVFNHTSDECEWAQQALVGDQHYQDFYYFFPDRTLPDQYEQHLREIFPEQAPGSFSYVEAVDRWVWTTFNRFQWDLNYSNPDVFNAMLGEMLYLANTGVEVLRLDAVVFIWKQLGTTCENLPQVHNIIRAYNALIRVAAPAMIFKSEAIVHPDMVASFIDPTECQLSYNPTMMALIWESLATREVRLLRHSMEKRFAIHPETSWVNYVRVHDDIGWSFADEDALELGMKGFDHRQFLNQFYTGRFPGSFARGMAFNFNPETLDMRISGACASLAGLEQALDLNNNLYLESAIRRILMIHSIIIAVGGIPLIYIGDELGTTNDYNYTSDPTKVGDNRWIHRSAFDWERANLRHDEQTVQGRIFQGIQHLIAVRKTTTEFAGQQTHFFDNGNPHVLSFTRNQNILVLANFSEHEQAVEIANLHMNQKAVDLVTQEHFEVKGLMQLAAYECKWIMV